ncbi:ABC transporter permease [Leekyejoonella antrihumi]|uniref:ABC transporter permease n=1 Tax=Leekyejoonella antrihumi TaxID=1660198 RepID=A0A563E7N0_9MICO|nr:ABC transporter permease [Leekyejoonella antrihumi]TWP38211.1 ABC transporter permease [Leekyejoonella antrihumi]
MRQALRYRWMQGVSIAVLAALVTTCAVFAPLYDRALQQSMVRTQLAHAPVDVSGIRLVSLTPDVTGAQPLNGQDLAALVPPSVQRFMQPAVTSSTLEVGTRPFNVAAKSGSLVSRSGACRHLTFVHGRCPTAQFDIAISTADQHNYGWHVGSSIPITELVTNVLPSKSAHATLHVVGVYSAHPGNYWFKATPTGQSGLTDPVTSHAGHDWWITPASTMLAAPWAAPVNEADLVMRTDRVDLDRLLALRAPMQKFLASPVPVIGNGTGQSSAYASSGIVDLANAAAHGRDQANILVPLFMVQLALLIALTLWLVLRAAIDQRRPEVALARLRGRSSAGARGMLLAELLPLIVVGLVGGVAAAFALSCAARHTWLVAGAPFEVRPPVLYTALAAVVGLIGMVLVAAQATATAAPAELLRRVVPRRRGWAMSVGDLLVVVVSGAAFIAFATGSLSGPVGTAAPTLLALAVGLLLAHALGPVTALVGRAMMRRGRATGGLAMLQIARRPGVRKIIATVTVATALLTFSYDALAVGIGNRTARAQAETGAALVATVGGTDVAATRAALHDVDPSGREVTPVVQLTAPGEQGTTTLAVVPSQFARIADFPGLDPAQLPWTRLAAPKTPPIRLHGTQLTLQLASAKLQATGPEPIPGAGLTPGQLQAVLVNSESLRTVVTLGELPIAGSSRHSLSVSIPCAKGCLLTGFQEYAGGIHPPFTTSATLADASVSGHPVDLGSAGAWRSITAAGDGSMTTQGANGSLGMDLSQSGTSAVAIEHASVPARIPALVSGPLPAGSQGNQFQAQGLDGILRDVTKVGTLAYVPGSDPDTTLVNLDVLQRDGAAPTSTALVQIFFARNDPALLAKVSTALKAHGQGIISTISAAQARGVFDRSAATWALQLGVVVGATAALLAALVLLIAVATSWRLRSRDYAALRMAGLRRRQLALISVGEQLPVVIISVLLGVACGVIGAHFAMPHVPLFATPPAIPVINLSISWPAVGLAGIGALIVVGVVAWLSGRWVAGRAHLDSLRETL